MPLSQDPILAEIDDDLRRERMRLLAKSMGSYVLGFSIAVLFGTIGIVVWKQHQMSVSEHVTTLLIDADSAVAQNRPADALPLLREAIAADHDSLSPLARLWLAKLTKADHPAEASQALAPLLQKEGSDPYRQYARLIEGDPAKFIALPDSALSGAFGRTLREERAVALLQAGRKADSAKDFRLLSDDMEAEESMRSRAALVLQTALAGSADAPPAAMP